MHRRSQRPSVTGQRGVTRRTTLAAAEGADLHREPKALGPRQRFFDRLELTMNAPRATPAP